MKIVVLVKQVPDTESTIKIAEDVVSINEQGIKWVMNPYDEFAVEEAVLIKEAGQAKVTILTLGPQRAVDAIRTGLGMGADDGIHIHCDEDVDALATARILSTALKDMEFDLIIAGQRAVDSDNYQVGAAVAEYLKIPHVSLVIDQKISGGKITCRRTVDGGTESVQMPLPALFTTQRGLNEPRYATLPSIMKAKKKPLASKTLGDLGIDPAAVGGDGCKVKVKAIKLAPQRGAIRMIEGETPQEMAQALVKVLCQELQVI